MSRHPTHRPNRQWNGRGPRRRRARSLSDSLLPMLFVGVLFWQLMPEVKSMATVASSSPQELADIQSSVYYPNCDAARADGAAPLHRGGPGYREGMDGDGDGVACEPYYGP